MKKQLDNSLFLNSSDPFGNFSNADEFIKYLELNGFHMYEDDNVDIPHEDKVARGYVWIRRIPSNYQYNYVTSKELNEKHLKMLKEQWRKIPGNSNTPISIEAYNVFAKWGKWKGGYVQNLGYVGVPAASIAEYGFPIYSNSWYNPGSSGYSFLQAKFYDLRNKGLWKGGYVDTWDYVSDTTHVLGSSLGFVSVNSSERQLGNVVNLSSEIGYARIELKELREIFKDCINESNNYDIDDVTLRNYLSSKFYLTSLLETGASISVFKSILEALKKHYGIILRIVTSTGYKNGQTVKYGNDYLIVDYNPIFRTFQYIDPSSNTVGNLDAKLLIENKVDCLALLYYQRDRK